MAEIKWIKIVTDIFDDEKMLLIESMPSADSIIVIWFKLLCLAGKTNNSGVFIFNERIPYTDEMLASIFRRDVKIVRVALNTFESFGMIEIIDSVITIPNWGKHQTLDAYEKRKARDRERIAKKRAEQKVLISMSADTSPDTSADTSPHVAPLEEDKEKEEDIEGEEDIKEGSPDEPPSPPPEPSVPPKKPKGKAKGETEPAPEVVHSYGNLSPRMCIAVEKWLQYKKERRDSYKPTGLQALVTEIENNVKRYGEDAVIGLINYCMSNNWKGIIFERLKNQAQSQPARGGGQAETNNLFAQMLKERRDGGEL